MASALSSTLEALGNLSTSVPEWNSRLDGLNGQIALRQVELARLTETERPPTRSLKNKGSTESLRPKDGEDNPFFSQHDDKDEIQMNPFESPKSNQNGFTQPQRPSSSRAARAAAVVTPPPPKASSNPRPSPTALTRQSSQPTPPTQPRVGPAILRKRKTDSLASGESMAPKYRTRSMIIVYYDSAVQTAFEELVKFVSGSRNAMRKGKMAAKMAEMRRAAELEVEADEDDDEDGGGDALNDLLTNHGNLMVAQKKLTPSKISPSTESGGDNGPEIALPKLRFVSTRHMGPPRDIGNRTENFGSTLSVGILRGYRRGGRGEAPDIFDELDKGLEWCQSQCEHAAHQFLRDGECSTEIANIKRKLCEVKTIAEKEMDRLRKEEASTPTPAPSMRAPIPEEGKPREMKTPQMRREFNTIKDLEVDDMEVDDEAVDDLEPSTKLVFKRSGDVAHSGQLVFK